jgi:hypothetical protein
MNLVADTRAGITSSELSDHVAPSGTLASFSASSSCTSTPSRLLRTENTPTHEFICASSVFVPSQLNRIATDDQRITIVTTQPSSGEYGRVSPWSVPLLAVALAYSVLYINLSSYMLSYLLEISFLIF